MISKSEVEMSNCVLIKSFGKAVYEETSTPSYAKLELEMSNCVLIKSFGKAVYEETSTPSYAKLGVPVRKVPCVQCKAGGGREFRSLAIPM